MNESTPVISEKTSMPESEIKQRQSLGHIHCIAEALNDGEICWDESDSREREPFHQVQKGELFSCWNFKKDGTTYSHEYGNMSGGAVTITTDVELKLIYVTDDADDPRLFETSLLKSPNIT